MFSFSIPNKNTVLMILEWEWPIAYIKRYFLFVTDLRATNILNLNITDEGAEIAIA